MITRRAAIEDAATFIEQYQDGWFEPLIGAAIPSIQINFYLDKERLGGFGIGSHVLAVPLMNREVAEDQIRALADRLGVPWPLSK